MVHLLQAEISGQSSRYLNSFSEAAWQRQLSGSSVLSAERSGCSTRGELWSCPFAACSTKPSSGRLLRFAGIPHSNRWSLIGDFFQIAAACGVRFLWFDGSSLLYSSLETENVCPWRACWVFASAGFLALKWVPVALWQTLKQQSVEAAYSEQE